MGQFVSEDAQAPEVNLLLALARRADSFYLPTSRDVEVTASFLYRDVDALLREEQCRREDPTATCSFNVASSEVPAFSDHQESLLWQKHRIHPDHARSLARMLLEGGPRFEPSRPTFTFNVDKPGALHFLGTHARVTEPPPGVDASVSPAWDHLDADFAIAPLENAVYGSAFGSPFGVMIPSELDFYNVASMQGFVARIRFLLGNGSLSIPGIGNLNLRYAGALSELVAVRDAILTGSKVSAGNPAAAYYTQAQRMIEAITAAVGVTSVAVRAHRIAVDVTGGCPEWFGSPSTCRALVQEKADGGANIVTDVTVTVAKGSPPDDLVAVNLGDNALDLGPQSTAARDPNYQSLGGYTRAQLDGEDIIQPVASGEVFDNVGIERRTYRIKWPATPNLFFDRLQFPTLLLRSRDASSTYAVLADALMYLSLRTRETTVSGAADVHRSVMGKYLAYAGTLGALAQQARQVLPTNWSRPALDGFGLPIRGVPPTSPELLGASQGETPVSFYLSSARRAAEEATQAVREAIDNLLAEQADQQLLQAAEERAQTVPQLERQSVCGDQVASCEVGTTSVDLAITPCTGDEFCDIQADILRVIPRVALISTPVAAAKDDETPPTFHDFEGGALQITLLEEWGALKAVQNFVESLEDQTEAWRSRYDAAQAQLAVAAASGDAARERVASECSTSAFTDAYLAGFSGSETGDIDATHHVSTDADGRVTGFGWEYSFEEGSESWSPGPLYAQMSTCDEAKRQLPVAEAQQNALDLQAVTVSTDAWAWAATQTSQGTQLVATLAIATAKIDNLVFQGEKAARIAELDGALQAAGRVTTFGTFRRFHHYDLWRARALLENSRRLAATARRAIEAHYVVDLSKMQADEPYVKSPATWADEVAL